MILLICLSVFMYIMGAYATIWAVSDEAKYRVLWAFIWPLFWLAVLAIGLLDFINDK